MAVMDRLTTQCREAPAIRVILNGQEVGVEAAQQDTPLHRLVVAVVGAVVAASEIQVAQEIQALRQTTPRLMQYP
jgi:hypothetical protein